MTGATGYKVERSPNGSTGWVQIAAPGATSFVDSGLNAGTTYYYRVRATTATADTSHGRTSSATTQTASSAPTIQATASTIPGQVDLSWSVVAGTTGYKIERSSGGGSWAQVTTTIVNPAHPTYATVLQDTVLPVGTHQYRVRATTAGGDTAYSNVASVNIATAAPAPLFGDDFDGAALSSSWTKLGTGYDWHVSGGGVVSQASTAVGDPKKLALNQSYGDNVEIVAKVRVDDWFEGGMPRVGVGLGTDAAGLGYNLVFHNVNGVRSIQFLHDMVTFGNSAAYGWVEDTWYWFKLRSEGGTLTGKVWRDGAA